MASTWGNSWNSSWGDSWGALEVDRGGSALGLAKPIRKAKKLRATAWDLTHIRSDARVKRTIAKLPTEADILTIIRSRAWASSRMIGRSIASSRTTVSSSAQGKAAAGLCAVTMDNRTIERNEEAIAKLILKLQGDVNA